MKIRKGQVIAVMQDQSFIQMQEDYLMAQGKTCFSAKRIRTAKAFKYYQSHK
ncbi:MAG: hypothetical protein WKG06_37570 [Segetibacter sp.]